MKENGYEKDNKNIAPEENPAERTDVLNKEDVSRETILADTDFANLYHLFRKGGMNRRESLFNAAYLVCNNKYEGSEANVKNKYKSVPSHPVSWAADKKKIHKNNVWSVGVKALNGMVKVAGFGSSCKRVMKGFFTKMARIPKSMDNSVRATKAFFRVASKVLLPAVAIAFGIYAGSVIYAESTAGYTFGIYVEGVYKGNTDDIYGVLEAKRLYERNLSDKYGTPLVLQCNVTFKAQKLDEDTLYKAENLSIYDDYVKGLTERGFGLYIDNSLAAVSESELVLDRTVNDYVEAQRLKYVDAFSVDEDMDDFVLSNRMMVVAAEYPKQFFLTENELRKLFDLPPVADITSDTSAGKIEELQYIKKEYGNIADTESEDNNGEFSYSLNLDYTKLDRIDSADGMSMDNSVPSNEVTVDVAIARDVTLKKVIPYTEEIIYDDTMLEGMRRLVTKGVDGQKIVHYKSTYQGNKLVSQEIIGEEILKVPVNKVVRVGTKEATEEEKALLPTGTYIYPYKGKMTSYYGWRTLRGQNDFHQGLDIFGPKGDPVVAADGGEVIEVGYSDGYGNYCIIRHNEDTVTRYAHCTEILVEEGDLVGQGFMIGTLGATGNVTGVHVHFEIIVNGNTVDPLPYMSEDPLPFVAV